MQSGSIRATLASILSPKESPRTGPPPAPPRTKRSSDRLRNGSGYKGRPMPDRVPPTTDMVECGERGGQGVGDMARPSPGAHLVGHAACADERGAGGAGIGDDIEGHVWQQG